MEISVLQPPRSFFLPRSFLLGTAISALQTEGGDIRNNWYAWSRTDGKIRDGSNCHIAADHWNRLAEDAALCRELCVHTHRFSIEWSRIEPEQGKFDIEALHHYRNESELLLHSGIRPLVTLHHFSNPLWFEEQGGFLNPRCIEWFERYTEFVVSHLGDLVSDWIPINEPNIYLTNSYILGIWPPGRQNPLLFIRGAAHIIQCHIVAYKAIHRVRRRLGCTDTKVGPAHHLRVFQYQSSAWPDKSVSWLYDSFFHEIFLSGMARGYLFPPFGIGYPLGPGDYQDFIGINYYSRDLISFDPWKPQTIFARVEVSDHRPHSELNWEIYPSGLYQVCARIYPRYKKPIYITENGLADASDRQRPRFIYDHLLRIHDLIDDGIPVERYYHWSLMDNFEWADGLSPRFGLYEVDYATLSRIPRRSARMYAQVCRERGFSDPTIRQFLTGATTSTSQDPTVPR